MKKAVLASMTVLVLVAFAACGGPSDLAARGTTTTAGPTATTATPGGAGPATKVTVTLKNIAFVPSEAAVKVGGTVEWRWADGGIPHTATADNKAFDSGDPSQTKGTYSYTFTKAGKYFYKCLIHPAMTATVTVS